MNRHIIIVTGRSGSGKSTAIAVFEDAGFYCVDNMPVVLLPDFLKLPLANESEMAGLAFVMDLRENGFLLNYKSVFNKLEKQGCRFEIIFLEASEDTLLRRYSQARRHHPLAGGKNLLEAIREEADQLEELRSAADKIIDTSRYTVHELKFTMQEIVKKSAKLTPMGINITSFGFKHGVPKEADLVVDVRFLANPFFVEELKNLDGTSLPVRDFVMNHVETTQFLEKYLNLIDFLIPLYEKEGKAYLTVAVGCTGGHHRSVVIARSIYDHIQNTRNQVKITHRDIDKQP
jgi:UPF0042 nucleotide-binding protein